MRRRARESARLSGHARGEVAAAADGAIEPSTKASGPRLSGSVALHELRSSLAAPRVLGALRAISAAERAASDARRLKLDALDAALDAAEARAEPPRTPAHARASRRPWDFCATRLGVERLEISTPAPGPPSTRTSTRRYGRSFP